jgi:hypothetical protein
VESHAAPGRHDIFPLDAVALSALRGVCTLTAVLTARSIGAIGIPSAGMAKRKQKPERARKPRRPAPAGPRESSVTEAATVAWTVAVTMVVVCDLAAIVAHAYLLRNPNEKGAALFGGLMIFAGAAIGVAALALLPVVYRLRQTPPPTGFAVFATCASAAPVLALVARLLAN